MRLLPAAITEDTDGAQDDDAAEINGSGGDRDEAGEQGVEDLAPMDVWAILKGSLYLFAPNPEVRRDEKRACDGV